MRLTIQVQTIDWFCPNCKVCKGCKNMGDDEKMLVCDVCDEAWHMYCLQPVVNELPEGKSL